MTARCGRLSIIVLRGIVLRRNVTRPVVHHADSCDSAYRYH